MASSSVAPTQKRYPRELRERFAGLLAATLDDESRANLGSLLDQFESEVETEAGDPSGT